ncbi:hypothetical protein CAter282_4407 [Collimonas arenae]|uniref:DUF2917 family protein n=1 Tax=Collimonas arenae TaxID=279058 RepID=A0A127QQ46_9BURK|nr:DUF2917 domain-containing protein [Collimonas arenae]AMP02172.1 hypothetical protein CAter10_4788 [Collimonas arenae]AMP12067.1 hypothetical protein CAter282_4407 [Collimonas arenae]
MRKLLANESLTIGAGQAMSVIAPVAQTLQIMRGRVWVTVAGQGDDYWLSAGQFLTVAADSHIVIEADKSSSLVQVQQLSTRLPSSSARAGFSKPGTSNRGAPVTC